MSLLKKIDRSRRALMRKLTRNIGTNLKINLQSLDALKVQRILIVRPNHRLGNLLLITPLVQELEKTFPNSKIDVFLKGGLGPIVFKNYDTIDQILSLPKKPFSSLGNYFKSWLQLKKHRYDLVIGVAKNSSSGRLSVKMANSDRKLFGDSSSEVIAKYSDHEHMAKFPIYNLREYLSKVGIADKNAPIPPLNMKLDSSEIENGNKVLKSIVGNDKKTIAIFTYATGNKCYLPSWWIPFYEKLLQDFADYNIVEILPIEKVSQIEFAAKTFYTKDIREMASVIANTSVFIGADSGIMHLASASLVPIVGFFSVTNPVKYGPYGKNSITADPTISSNDEIINLVKSILQ